MNQKFESFVTSVRSYAEALSALVWSASIRRGLSGRRPSCIVTEDGVAPVLRLALDEEFDNVLTVPAAMTKEYSLLELRGMEAVEQVRPHSTRSTLVAEL